MNLKLKSVKRCFPLMFIFCQFLVSSATEDQEVEPFEPFAFELETDDELGFTSNHMHALVGTQKPNFDNSQQILPAQFPINHRPIVESEAAKVLVSNEDQEKDENSKGSQEFQSENSVEKTQNDKLVTSTEFLLDSMSNSTKSLESNQSLCDSPQDIPTFIKYSRVLHKSAAKISRKMESLKECAQNCRNKMTLDGENTFDCHGFSFLGRTSENKCEFYETHEFEFSPIEKRENRFNYFERLCLTIPKECSNSAYSFEIQPERFLPINPIEDRVVENRKQCLDFCLDHQNCRAVNHNKVNGTCQLLDKISQNFMSSLNEDTDFDYYENMFLNDHQHCENGHRMDFVVTKNTQISFGSGLDINLGSLSIANCMRECAESTLIFCRSFQYDPITHECLLVEETGANAVRSEQYDLYEPVCLNNEIDVPCQGDRVFERIPRMNLVGENVLAHLKDISLGSCMEACLFEENCLSFTYHRPERRCKILPLNRKNNQTRAIVETFIDYYELACDRKAVLKNEQILTETVSPDLFTTRQPLTTETDKNFNPTTVLPTTTPRHACDISQSVIIENGRTLRIAYRNLHHVNVHLLDRCQSLCSEASIKCATFAYNQKTGDCLLSTTKITKNFPLVTQQNPNFDLYGFLGTNACAYNDTSESTIPPTTTIKSSTQSGSLTNFPSITPTHSVGEFTATMFLSDPFDPTTDPTISTHPTLIPFTNTNQILREPKLEPIFETDIQPKQATRQLPEFTTPAQITRHIDRSKEVTTSRPSPLESVLTTTSQVLPHRDKTMERLPTSRIHVTAMCLERGVNVTFKIENNNYTGAVYAAERFSQCRIFVEGRNEFSIFVTRPSVNNFCNALEEEGELTAVLVMSNDMVLPYDVTTKDDFFYQITCDYTKGEQNSLIKTGIVVGGPEPKSVMSNKKLEDKQNRVFLKILKNGRPVTKVYIGEKLTAIVESDLEVNRLRVTDCNATRVGGREPRPPNSVQLIKDGCAVMPQIMGNIMRGPLGLEASFTAFRIDGSDQIDIVCGIIVCKQRCDDKSPQCPEIRNKRNTEESGSEMIIDQRLQVLVDDRPAIDQKETIEPQSLLHMILNMDPTRTEYCMNPLIVVILLSIFLLTFVALAISLTVLFCRKRTMRFPHYSSHRLGFY